MNVYIFWVHLLYLQASLLWKLTDSYKSTLHYPSILFDPCCYWFTTMRTPNLAIVKRRTQKGPCSGKILEGGMMKCKNMKIWANSYTESWLCWSRQFYTDEKQGTLLVVCSLAETLQWSKDIHTSCSHYLLFILLLVNTYTYVATAIFFRKCFFNDIHFMDKRS